MYLFTISIQFSYRSIAEKFSRFRMQSNMKSSLQWRFETATCTNVHSRSQAFARLTSLLQQSWVWIKLENKRAGLAWSGLFRLLPFPNGKFAFGLVFISYSLTLSFHTQTQVTFVHSFISHQRNALEQQVILPKATHYIGVSFAPLASAYV